MNLLWRWWLLLSVFLLAKTLFLGWYINEGVIGLGPDEAQYWTWSQRLDWGYYSKPPGVAWQIALGTALLGDGEAGVRLMALVWGVLQPLSLAALALVCGMGQRVAVAAAALWAVTPLGALGSLMAITDGGMVFFWTMALMPWLGALWQGQRRCHWWLMGLFIGCGALFKWPIYLLWVIVMALLPWSALSVRGLVGGMALSTLGLLPTLWWNLHHDWATFLHVGTTIAGGHGAERGATALPQGNFGDFVGAQALLLSPFLFLFLLLVWYQSFRRTTSWSVKALALSSLLPLSALALASLWQKMQGNWCVFAMPSAVLLVAYYGLGSAVKGRWLAVAAVASLCLSTLMLALPSLSGCWLPWRMNPFKHSMGHAGIAAALRSQGYDPAVDVLFAARYQDTSLLWFYGPAQRPTYFLNIYGVRRNQFTYWPSMADEATGRDGFFAAIDGPAFDTAVPLTLLSPFFKEVTFVGAVPLVQSCGVAHKQLFLYRCLKYNGNAPQAVDKF